MDKLFYLLDLITLEEVHNNSCHQLSILARKKYDFLYFDIGLHADHLENEFYLYLSVYIYNI